jgi:biopolymer transport protein ExbD
MQRGVMNENKLQWILGTLPVIFVALSFSACQHNQAQRQLSGNEALPANKDVKVKPDSNSKILLNNQDMGTTRNLSTLSNELKRVFEERGKYGAFKENTYEIEKTVFIDAEPSLKVSEITEVISALEDSGADPLMLRIETNQTNWDWANSNTNSPPVKEVKPNPLRLVVEVGKSKNHFLEEGIVLRLNQTTIPGKESFGLDGLVVDVRKEGEYLIEDKLVKKTALENTFKTFFRKASSEDSKYIIVNLENNADKISFGSVLDIAREAYNAGIKELELRIYFPTEWKTVQIGKWSIESMSLPTELTKESESTESKKNKDVTWTDYSRSWEKPSKNIKVRFDVNLSITTWDADFAKVLGRKEFATPEDLLMHDHLANERAKTNEDQVEEASYLELNGVRGSFFRATYGEDKNQIMAGWHTYRYYEGKAQRIDISIVCARSELQKAMMIIKSLKF